MANSELKIIKLACVGCGANLEISQEMNRLACSFCGTQQIVERGGGAIHLRGVAEAISKVQVGTDKTAAELAIVRLTKDLEKCKTQMAAEEQKYGQLRTQKVMKLNEELESKRKTVNTMVFIITIVAAIPLGIICKVVIFGIFSYISPDLGASIAFISFVLGCIVAAVMFRKLIIKNDRYNPDKLKADFKKEITQFDKVIAQSLSPYNKEIEELNARIKRNYEIANS